MKFETDDFRITRQLFGVTRDRGQIRRAGIERRKHAGKRLRIVGNEFYNVVVGIARAIMHGRRMPTDQQCFDVLLEI